jgi:hypothetical protein
MSMHQSVVNHARSSEFLARSALTLRLARDSPSESRRREMRRPLRLPLR